MSVDNRVALRARVARVAPRSVRNTFAGECVAV